MDPLSITASVISFVEIAKRIKASVEKVIGLNRRTLQELTSDVVDELTELQKLCDHQQEVLDRTHLDYDSKRSLEKLQSELNKVLERCLKIIEPRGHSRLSSVKSYVIAWIKNAEIEADILHLKDRVSSVHRRFTYITSVRMENNLLVVNTENRARMNRMEDLVSQLLIDSHLSGINPPVFLDHAGPDGIEFQFLRLQVGRIMERLSNISATGVFLEEGLHDTEPLQLSLKLSLNSSEASAMRLITIETLQVLQLLELGPAELSFQDHARQLLGLVGSLQSFELVQDAIAVNTLALGVCRALMRRNTEYMPYVVWALMNHTCLHSQTPDALEAAKSAVSIYKAMSTPSQQQSSLQLAQCVRAYAAQLMFNGHYEECVEVAKEALYMQRNAPEQNWSTAVSVAWEASGEERVVLSPAREIVRNFFMAVEEGLCLRLWAASLASVGRYAEAALVGTEAINCYTALCGYAPFSFDSSLSDVRQNRSGWISIVRPPQPFASISDADEDDEDVTNPAHSEGEPMLNP